MITGNEPIASCFLRQLGEEQDNVRIATPQDLENKHISHYIIGNKGLTIRQQFAAMAMQGILSNSNETVCYNLTVNEGWQQPETIAEISVKMARALINELNKTEKQ